MVSILLPSYNHAEFLEQCLNGVIEQSFQEWELIAVDDCSSDRSVEVLQEQEDPRIQVHVNPRNLGTYGALDRALSLAKGEYVAVLNSDDWWLKDKLRLQLELLEANPDLPFAYTSGRPVPGGAAQQPEHWPKDSIQELLPFLLAENHVLASSVLFRRSSASFRPELRYSGDWTALLGPSRDGAVGFIDNPLTMWRQHDRNTYRRSPGQVDEEIRLREGILAAEAYWRVPRLPSSAINHGLSECACHLSALYVLQGRMPEARKAARMGLRFHPSKRTLRRLSIVSLSGVSARKSLWAGERVDRPNESGSPVSLPGPAK
jgi:glycosyltransferase involved in cell wall biosynthesis